jgi:hypothetical protein
MLTIRFIIILPILRRFCGGIAQVKVYKAIGAGNSNGFSCTVYPFQNIARKGY